MSAIDNFFKEYKSLVKRGFTFFPCFEYWKKVLLEYSTRLFTYEGLPESIPQHEIDVIAYLRGYCPIVKIVENGVEKWIAANSSGMYGLTDYLDYFTKVNFNTPLHFGERTIGKNAVIVRNTSIMLPLMMKIEHYAAELAHVDISIIAELVNNRTIDELEAINSAAAEGANEVYKMRYDGVPRAIINKGFSQYKHNFVNARSQNENSTLWELRNNILSGYLEEIGIKKSFDKRERQITSEISSDDKMLSLNITDMLECRQKAMKELSELTGLNISVSCNIDYMTDKGGNTIDIESTP